jgi:hypothetical protein
MEPYEMGSRPIPLSRIEHKIVLFGLKFCVGGSTIEEFEGEAKGLIFALCIGDGHIKLS